MISRYKVSNMLGPYQLKTGCSVSFQVDVVISYVCILRQQIFSWQQNINNQDQILRKSAAFLIVSYHMNEFVPYFNTLFIVHDTFFVD